MVRGVASLGRVCDSRTNPAIVERPCSDARWRDPCNRWSVVAYKGDNTAAAAGNGGLFKQLFGASRLTLVYNCADTLSLLTLAELLVELYDVKLAGFRSLPPVWWYDLLAYERASIAALNRGEFSFCVSETGAPSAAAAAAVPKDFDPLFQVTADPVALARYCHGDMCIAAGTQECHVCGLRLCEPCHQQGGHANGDCKRK